VGWPVDHPQEGEEKMGVVAHPLYIKLFLV